MIVLVTGGAGFIGSHVGERLLSTGHRVTVVDDLSSGKEHNLPPGADFARLDIRGPGFAHLVDVLKPEVIFHLAAQMDVRRSVADPQFDASVNVLGTVNLLEAATRNRVRKIVFSSTGGAIYGEQDVFPAPESHPCRPVSPYGASKLCGETYLAYFERAGGPKGLVLRYANVYGPRQDPHGEAGVVAIFSRQLLQGLPATLFGDGGQTRDFVYVGDVARANLLALEAEGSGVFNIGTGNETDIAQLYAKMSALVGRPGSPVHAAARPGEQRRSVIDPSLARVRLGWTPQVSLDEGLQHTLAFFRKTSE